MIDDDASRIADHRNEEPSSTIEQRSGEALEDGRDGSGALLAPVNHFIVLFLHDKVEFLEK